MVQAHASFCSLGEKTAGQNGLGREQSIYEAFTAWRPHW
uniref:Uncharacterized protein n=1 Tax=Setaria viridis TaxID=4556 RepID=A0A4U6UV85_SETVI|nr:hypothetical protein SEVIR_4G092801v2 [Setaria viridis]